MSEWLTTNWFQAVTLIGIVIGWAVHYGISQARWNTVSDKVDEMEDTLDGVQESINIHTSNTEIHVSSTLLQLFDERSDYVKQQFTDTRNDIQRIEGMLSHLATVNKFDGRN